jgi:hypothetical protein
MTQLLSREQITPETGIEEEFRDIIQRLLDQRRKAQERAALIHAARMRLAARQSSPDSSQPSDI